MLKRVEVIGGVEYTYRIYKDGSEAVLFQRKVKQAPDRASRRTRDLSLQELIDTPYPRVSPDEMFERAWELWHPTPGKEEAKIAGLGGGDDGRDAAHPRL